MTEQEITEAISEELRRSDAFTNAATRLIDDEESKRGRAIEETDPGFWRDIREHVLPVLEAEADKGSEELERLHQQRRQLRA
jgi:hypothetical protein